MLDVTHQARSASREIQRRGHRSADIRCGAIVRVADAELRHTIECLESAVDDNHHTLTDVQRRHAVGDDEERELVFQSSQRLLDEQLGVWVERARRLVKHKNLGIGRECAR
jgi:hypothetical protein